MTKAKLERKPRWIHHDHIFGDTVQSLKYDIYMCQTKMCLCVQPCLGCLQPWKEEGPLWCCYHYSFYIFQPFSKVTMKEIEVDINITLNLLSLAHLDHARDSAVLINRY